MDTEITIADLQTVRLMVCTPMHGGMCAGTYTNMTIELGRWASVHNIHVQFEFIFNESIVSRARCDLAHKFLQSDCTHMVFVDADISLDPLDLMRMVFLTRAGTIVGAPCSGPDARCVGLAVACYMAIAMFVQVSHRALRHLLCF